MVLCLITAVNVLVIKIYYKIIIIWFLFVYGGFFNFTNKSKTCWRIIYLVLCFLEGWGGLRGNFSWQNTVNGRQTALWMTLFLWLLPTVHACRCSAKYLHISDGTKLPDNIFKKILSICLILFCLKLAEPHSCKQTEVCLVFHFFLI